MHSWNIATVFLVAIFCCIQCGSSIKCYYCNSNDNPKCADPFDVDMVDLVTVDCDAVFPNENSTFCRKTYQRITAKTKFDERVIRTCGYEEERRFDAPDDDDENSKGNYRCYLKPGTFGVELQYCACEEDGCNGVGKINSYHILPIMTIGAMFLKYFY